MKKQLPFHVPVTGDGFEIELLSRLDEVEPDDEYVETLWQLVRFYRSSDQLTAASALTYALLDMAVSADAKAFCYLGLGQIAEVRSQFEAAVDFYTRGLTFRTNNKQVKYLLHNNTGYCLNVQGMYRPAETYCRLAIEIDSGRANAFKNLGISLWGQNKLIGAAWAYMEATKADATDPRASHLLEQLLRDHPEIKAQLPGFLQESMFNKC